MSSNTLTLGLVSISDRASQGVYEDKGLPALEAWFSKVLLTPFKVEKRLIPDEKALIESTLIELIDQHHCDLVLTTGGTGPSRRDVTPEATLAVASREMPGFGEQMRAISAHFVPTATLSRQVGALREIDNHAALMINLPGNPRAITETLEGLKDENNNVIVNGLMASIPYCIDLIEGPYIETNEAIVKAFRPKHAKKTIQRIECPFKDEDLLVLEPTKAKQQAPQFHVIWMHGLGADNKDFENFSDELLQAGGPYCRFYLPNAPIRELSLHPGFPLRAWYDLLNEDFVSLEDRIGLEESASKINQLIAYLESQGIERNKIVLGGFSQGAALTLYTGLRQEKPLGALIALSGYLPFAKELNSLPGKETPTFMGHGLFDSIISPLLVKEHSHQLSRVLTRYCFNEYAMEHEINEAELLQLAHFFNSLD